VYIGVKCKIKKEILHLKKEPVSTSWRFNHKCEYTPNRRSSGKLLPRAQMLAFTSTFMEQVVQDYMIHVASQRPDLTLNKKQLSVRGVIMVMFLVI